MKGEHIILRGVNNDSFIFHPLPESHFGRKIRSVWLLLNEADFAARGGEALHHVNAFMDDRMHDWNQKDNTLRYHAHSSAKGDIVDVVVFFEEAK